MHVGSALGRCKRRLVFGVVTGHTILPARIEFLDGLGNLITSRFYSAEDTNGALPSVVDTIELTWSGIDMASFENLSLAGAFARDDDGTNQGWDTGSSVIVSYSIDGGAFQTLLVFASEVGLDGNQTNEVPRVDTDFDGVGDGAELAG